MGRFDYVKYDQLATDRQGVIKASCQELEQLLYFLDDSRPKALAIAKLEEFYMWVGKAIRDDQIKRNFTAPLQEQRGES